MQDKHKKLLSWFGFFAGVAFVVLTVSFLLMSLPMGGGERAGVTFSRTYTQELGLDPEEVLINILDDLQVRLFRIPAYWSLIEARPDVWTYDWLDNDLNNIADRGGTVTLAVGEKLPRWPECWIPEWARQMPPEEREQAVLRYLEKTITRYKDHTAVEMWQIENEPGFPFGTCPPVRREFIDQELALIKNLDQTRPIATTDSGELSIWKLGRKVDLLGVSVYRVVIGPLGIFRYWFIPPQFYLRKGQATQGLWKFENFYISEFQMEPWTKRPSLTVTPLDEQMQTFDIQQMRENIDFARNTGISKIDYWGVEWWYWMKKVHNQPIFWEQAKTLFP